MQPYGLPLDNRKTITKIDWEIWTASLSTNPQQFSNLVRDLVRWADESSSRVPLTDYYDAVSGKQIHFQARSVVGGIFIKALLRSVLRGSNKGISENRSIGMHPNQRDTEGIAEP
jgi:hypothetical protein